MVYGKALWRFSICLVILMLILTPFSCSSHPRLQGETTVAEDATSRATVQGVENNVVKRLGKGDSDGNHNGVIEDSAREVPTGPDPLHHNNKPIQP